MKNLLKKLHIMSNQSEYAEGSKSKSLKGGGNRSPARVEQSKTSMNSSSEQNNKPLSGLLNWINSVANRGGKSGPYSPLNAGKGELVESSDTGSVGGADTASDVARVELESANLRDPDVEEEYQIKMAMELSAKEDPEAVQIEAVKQMSLGSCAPDNSPAELVAYRYWNYNALGFDDKILDGFYDVYGVLSEFTSERMPSLIDLQAAPLTDSFTWEAVLVSRSRDSNLLKLEDKAMKMVVKSRSEHMDKQGYLVGLLAVLVSDYMGGPVENPDNMLRAWKSLSYSLKTTLGSRVLPLGSLTIGLARHRALLFKVLADSVGIPCRLVKGQQCKGSSDVAMNFVKIDDGRDIEHEVLKLLSENTGAYVKAINNIFREFIVDLMADPGTLIPSDLAGLYPESDESLSCTSPLSRDVDSCHAASSSSGFASSYEESSEFGPSARILNLRNATGYGSDTKGEAPHLNLSRPVVSGEGLKTSSDDSKNPEKVLVKEVPAWPSYAYAHARSPSWTEGVSSPAVHRMKVKDVSQYMINATKENPQLAQKLHNVLLESGVVAPPNLFSDIYPNKGETSSVDSRSRVEAKRISENEDEKRQDVGIQGTKDHVDHNALLPPLPHPRVHHKPVPSNQPEQLKHVEGLGSNLLLPGRESTIQAVSSPSEGHPAAYSKNVPVAAAAAAAAAVVASSMVVAVAKSSADSNLELPMAAAAKATAAAVAATTAAVTKQYEQGIRSDVDTDALSYEVRGSGDCDRDSSEAILEGEKVSDRSVGHDCSKSDIALEEVGEFEIPWEEITLGERIGLGSYGEVYRGEWNGTEVAVKKLLDQEISGETLEEFISEVLIMMRVRHPNVVLFMGAVIRPPNLSIVTEFLPRGSLYRLIHRPNNQLDERRRLRMALDAARGLNYLHNCTPAIVHRDLKSPNLLVDKNWVVKVCDFGLSRRKNSTFLSSRSTAGTAEWMAPEVLRNEPSDEKCDVYSYGVILWELFTLQQPWGGMNPMQVVGAVGYQHRRLDIPDDMDPSIADIIRKCWETDPRLRPSFAEIMAALKPLQKPLTSSQLSRHERGQPSQFADETAG